MICRGPVRFIVVVDGVVVAGSEVVGVGVVEEWLVWRMEPVGFRGCQGW